MLTRTFTLVLLLLCLSIQLSIAQGGDERPYLETIIPPSPNASAFGRSGNVPVDLFTGQLQFQVPIYTIKVKGYAFPISLSYSSTGLRVQEVPSRTGMGWNLNATGVITRTARGIGDDKASGYLAGTICDKLNRYIDNQMSDNEKRQYEHDVSTGKLDSESDVFSINVNGISGRIIFECDSDGRRKPYIIPHQKLQIETNPTEDIGTWKVTDEDGNIYEFGNPEQTWTCTGEWTCTVPVNSTWYLVKLTPSTGGGAINFSYREESLQMPLSQSLQGYTIIKDDQRVECSSSEGIFSTEINTTGYVLDNITWAGGSIAFKKGKSRKDHSLALPTVHELGEIEILDNHQKSIKSFALEYTYFGERHVLKSITETGSDGVTKSNPYVFSYNGEGLPSPSYEENTKMDHWGYYNGSISGSLLPRETLFFYSGTKKIILSLKGGDRSVNNSASIGQLKRITYPTKGFTEIDYEVNDHLYDLGPNSAIACDNIKREQYVESVSKADRVIFTDEDTGTITLTKGHCVKLKYSLYAKDAANGETRAQASFGNADFNWGDYLIHKGGDPNNSATGKSESVEVFLEAGTYSFRTFAETNGGGDAFAKFSIEYTNDLFQNQPVGGVRVAKTRDYTDEKAIPVTKTYLYRTLVDPLKSSGVLFKLPVYSYNHSKYRTTEEEKDGIPNVIGVECGYIARTSNSQVDLAGAFGHHIGYSNVTELIGENGEGGKVEYVFLLHEARDNSTRGFPFPPTGLKSWLMGKQVIKAVYGHNGAGFYPISETKTNYHTPTYDNTTFTKRIYNAKIGIAEEQVDKIFSVFSSAVYNHLSDWQYVKDVRTTNYFPDGGKVVSTTQYLYGNNTHLNPTQIQEESSSGKTQVSLLKYPTDYAAASPLQPLVDRNILNKVVEKQVKEGDKLIGGQISEYGISSANTLIIKNRFLLDNSTASAQSEIPSLSSLNYKLQESFGYGSAGETVEYRQRESEPNAITWDATHTYVLSSTKNALPSEIFHASFEETGTEGSGAKTGSRFHTGDYSFSPPSGFAPVAGSTLSYWSWSVATDKWRLVEQAYDGGSVTCSGDRVDEVRITPPGAQMTTYTYEPLVGVRSVTDPNGKTSYYEYDPLGRLKAVRDQDGNILQTHEYRFAGQ